VIRIESSRQGRVRVIGALRSPPLQTLLLDSVGGAEVELDLSEVHEADADAVRMLAQLPADRCRVVACPKWLALWIEIEQRRLLSRK
jgi:hypothetical protein